MLLAIDIGNTNIVFAVYQQKNFTASWRCHTNSAKTSDEYAAFLTAMLLDAGIDMGQLEDIIICSVVPDANFQIRKFCQRYLKKEPVFVDASIAAIKIDLDKPEEAGADRLVNAVAVKAFYPMPAIVIDFGTATTFDVVSGEGIYSGGVIAPGINLSIEALYRAAAKLPKIAVRKTEKVIGKSTVTAIQSGIYWGYIGLIEGLVQRISEELDEKVFVLATGGLAPLFAANTTFIDQVDDELTLKGLHEIHQACRKKNDL